jgi:hypothetical protein
MPGRSSWMPCAPQGVKGLDDDNDDMCVSSKWFLSEGNKLLSAQIVSVTSLIWQRVSTSQGNL